MDHCLIAGRRARILTTAALIALGWRGGTAQQTPAGEVFRTAEPCLTCHSGTTIISRDSVSLGGEWRASMMANAARDPFWQAAVRREVLDHPLARKAIEDKCATCHMPMSRFESRASRRRESVFEHLSEGPAVMRADRLALDGVSCTSCHLIEPDGLGTPRSFSGGFRIDTARAGTHRGMYGPFAMDSGRTRLMRSAADLRPEQAEHIRRSEVCASCHTFYTHALGPDGVGGGELPQQVPYLEWLHSDFSSSRSCQSCHMPTVEDSAAMTSVWGETRSGVSRHVFGGGNAFVLRMLRRYHSAQGVAALPAELDAAIQRTEENLSTRAARLAVEHASIASGRLTIALVVENLTGHKLPTAFPSRRVWLHVTIRDAAGTTLFESGALERNGRVTGNDNDLNAAKYEPHYRIISRDDQVQIYEAIMANRRGAVTTGLLSAVRFVKDNRLLPRGFDPTTASRDVAVRGHAERDADFADGRDRITYVADIGNAAGPFTVSAELWHQAIGYRWVENMRAYDAPETNRFVSYYDAMADSSAVRMARMEMTVLVPR